MISEFARISVPDAWDHGRNPVPYSSLNELGISLDDLRFQPMPSESTSTMHSEHPIAFEPEPPFTIAEAKKRLAVTFGVKPEAVELTIRS